MGHPPKGTKESADGTKSRQNAQISLATQLQDLSQVFRKIQSNYLKSKWPRPSLAVKKPMIVREQ